MSECISVSDLKHVAYRYRIYPTQAQQRWLGRVFGATRYIYNWGLATRQAYYTAESKTLPYPNLSVSMTQHKKEEDKKWLTTLPAQVLQQSLVDLQAGYENFFKKQAKFPRFKKKGKSRDSCRFPNQSFGIRKDQLRLAKGGLFKINLHRPLSTDAKLLSCTISLDRSGRYHASILVQQETSKEKIPQPALSAAVGIDLGISSLLILSTGEKIDNPKHADKDRKALAHAQRSVSRKQLGSRNRAKANKRVARIHARIADRRRDNLHKITTRLVRENQAIMIEDLNVAGMVRNHSLARAIQGASWGELTRQLEYKCDWYNRELIKIDRWFPSSKTCSECGYLSPSLPLSQREWECPSCNTLHDRDINAAKNILAVGSTVSACGGGARPALEPASAGSGEGNLQRSKKRTAKALTDAS